MFTFRGFFSGGVFGNGGLTPQQEAELANKQDKVIPSQVGNIQTLDAQGNTLDSGKIFNDSGATVNDIWSASKVQEVVNNASSGKVFFGTWDASTNTPTLPNPPIGKQGDYRDVAVAGTQFGLDFSVGDRIIIAFNDATQTLIWIKEDFNQNATQISYDNTISGLTAENVQDAIDEHATSTSNPHDVTKTQVGLANVPNTDATNLSNDTIQGTFTPNNTAILTNDDGKVAFEKTQGQLNKKVDVSTSQSFTDVEKKQGSYNINGIPTFTTSQRDVLSWTAGNVIFNSTLKVFQEYNGTSWLNYSGYDGVPLGSTVLHFGPKNTIPQGWIALDGDAFLKTDYPELNDFLQNVNSSFQYTTNLTTYQNSTRYFYHTSVGDTQFITPKTGGYFPRGLDSTGIIDPDGASRVVGDIQQDDIKSHTHTYDKFVTTGQLVQSDSNLGADETIADNVNAYNSTNTGGLSGSETRPKNVSCYYIIKAKIQNPLQNAGVVAGTNATVQTITNAGQQFYEISFNPGVNYPVFSDIPRKNFVINPCFEISQRGTSFTGINTTQYLTDTYSLNIGNSSVYNWNVFPLTATDLLQIGTGVNYVRWQQTNAAASAGRIEYKIPNIRASSGRQVTISFWARAMTVGQPAPTELVIDLVQNFGVGGNNGSGGLELASNNNPIPGSGSLTTAWTRLSHTVTFPTFSEGGSVVVGTNHYYYFRIKNRQTQAFEIDITNLKMDIGNVATRFERPNIIQTLGECQRFFERISQANNPSIGMATYQTTTSIEAYLKYTPKLFTPVITPSASTALSFKRQNATVTSTVITTTPGLDSAIITATVGSGIAGDAGILSLGASQFLDIKAEL